MSVAGGDMSLPDRIKHIQGQMRIAILNHSVSWQRLIHAPDFTEVESLLKMLQSIILSLGRRQAELMYEYKHELRLKFPNDEEMQKKVSMEQLGWPDRCDDMRLPNGSDPGRKPTVQVVKRHANIQIGRPSQKMTSLLKPAVKPYVGGNANHQLQRKESERLKAAAARLTEVVAPVNKKPPPGQKPKIVLNSSTRRTSNEKLSDSDSFPELKESELAGYRLTPQDKAVEISELSQDQYLGFFGLVHKDKSKSIVVNQTKRKRRSAAGQSDFYKDFFQPKRPYNRKTLMTNAGSPSSCQELAEVDSTEFSPPSEKPSVPPSPASSCSTELLEETTPIEGSPAAVSAESLGDAEQSEGPAPSGNGLRDTVETAKNVDSVAEGSSGSGAENPLLAEDPVSTAKEPLITSEGSSTEREPAAHSSPAAGKGCLPDIEESSQSTGKNHTVAVEGESLGSAEKPLPPDDESSSSLEKPSSAAEEPSADSLLAAEGPPLGKSASPMPETADSACTAPVTDVDQTPCSTPESDNAKRDGSTKMDVVDDCEAPQDESVSPSSTNEDDEGDSDPRPTDLVGIEPREIPADPRKIESSSVGEESNGEAGVDISAMIGENVQYLSANAEDCSEMVSRYRLEGQSEEEDGEEETERSMDIS